MQWGKILRSPHSYAGIRRDDISAPGPSPFRGTFVGLQREMGESRAALEDAIFGQGRLVMPARYPSKFCGAGFELFLKLVAWPGFGWKSDTASCVGR